MNKQLNNKNIILINKPKHWTSNDVVRKVKNLLKVKKVGHAGTLDPLASGLLILGINDGTKALNNLLTEDKVYVATIHFNYYTDTNDSEGNILKYEQKDIFLENVIQAINSFILEDYYQYPPKYSAIKINGKKAYELARENKEFEIKPKLVKLFDYKILSFIDKELVIELHVSKGFYIRSFAYDLGIKLDNYANLADLKRTSIGSFSLNDALEISEVKEHYYDY